MIGELTQRARDVSNRLERLSSESLQNNTTPACVYIDTQKEGADIISELLGRIEELEPKYDQSTSETWVRYMEFLASKDATT